MLATLARNLDKLTHPKTAEIVGRRDTHPKAAEMVRSP